MRTIKEWYLENRANLITTVGLVFSSLLAATSALKPENLWPILCLYVSAGLTDFLDGKIARKHHIESNLGAIIDPARDRIIFLSQIILMVQYYSKFHYSLFVLLALAAIYEARTAYMGVVGISWYLRKIRKVELASSKSGKRKTFCNFFVGLLIIVYLFPAIPDWIWVQLAFFIPIYGGFFYMVFLGKRSIEEYKKAAEAR